MKTGTYMPMYNHYFKYIGALIVILGSTLYGTYQQAEIVLYFGLFIISFSKEKEETDLIISIRNDLFKSVFGYYIALMISLTLTSQITDFVFTPTSFISIGVPLLLYLIVFYTSVLFKLKVDSTVDLSSNIKNYKKTYLIYTISIIGIAVFVGLKNIL